MSTRFQTIKAAIVRTAERYVEAAAWADPTGLAFYPVEAGYVPAAPLAAVTDRAEPASARPSNTLAVAA